jgi:hypothetical protein
MSVKVKEKFTRGGIVPTGEGETLKLDCSMTMHLSKKQIMELERLASDIRAEHAEKKADK